MTLDDCSVASGTRLGPYEIRVMFNGNNGSSRVNVTRPSATVREIEAPVGSIARVSEQPHTRWRADIPVSLRIAAEGTRRLQSKRQRMLQSDPRGGCPEGRSFVYSERRKATRSFFSGPVSRSCWMRLKYSTVSSSVKQRPS